VLEQVLLFATSALRVRDTHSVNLVLLFLRDLIPHFAAPGPVHDFLCHDVLRAAITSLHEPYFVDLQKDLASLIVYIVQLDAGVAAGRPGEAPTEGAAAPDPAAAVLASLPGLASSDGDNPRGGGGGRVAEAVSRVRALAPARRAAAAAATANATESPLSPMETGDDARQPADDRPAPRPPSAHAQAQDMRVARAVVLDLLEQIRGVGIHEMGRIVPAASAAAAAAAPSRAPGGVRGGMAFIDLEVNGGGGNGVGPGPGGPAAAQMRAAQRAAMMDDAAAGGKGLARGGSPDLDGVSKLLG
jgi:hypothetical protein